MSRAARSLKYFAVYLLLLGLSLVLVPNLIITPFGMATTSEVWIRVVGVLAFNIGIYYWFAARSECREVFWASVYTRALVLVSFTAFVAMQWSEPVLMLFGLVDFCGGVWTWRALRSSAA